MTFGNDRFTAT